VSRSDEIPVSVLEIFAKQRAELIEQLAEVDDEIAEFVLNDTLGSSL
jgi:elongation factor G